MSEAIDQVTVNWEEDGELKVKELKRPLIGHDA